MSALILQFPCGRRDRTIVRPERADFTPPEGCVSPTLEGQVRAMGYRWGLNSFDRAALVALAKHHHNIGLPDTEILRRAEYRARQQANRPRDPQPA